MKVKGMCCKVRARCVVGHAQLRGDIVKYNCACEMFVREETGMDRTDQSQGSRDGFFRRCFNVAVGVVGICAVYI